jgi:hypothetical protein
MGIARKNVIDSFRLFYTIGNYVSASYGKEHKVGNAVVQVRWHVMDVLYQGFPGDVSCLAKADMPIYVVSVC